MVPDIDLQLRVVIKALRDVVLPAVDPSSYRTCPFPIRL